MLDLLVGGWGGYLVCLYGFAVLGEECLLIVALAG